MRTATATAMLALATLMAATVAAQAAGQVGSFTIVGEGKCQPKSFLDSSQVGPPAYTAFQWTEGEFETSGSFPLNASTMTFSGNSAVIENPANLNPGLAEVKGGKVTGTIYFSSMPTLNPDGELVSLSCNHKYKWTIAEDAVIELQPAGGSSGTISCGCSPVSGLVPAK